MFSFEIENPLFNYYFIVCLVGQSSQQIPGNVVFRLSQSLGLEALTRHETTASAITFGRLPRSSLIHLQTTEDQFCWKIRKNPLKTIVSDFKTPTLTRFSIESFQGLDYFLISTSTEQSRIPLLELEENEHLVFDDIGIHPQIPLRDSTNFRLSALKFATILEALQKRSLSIRVSHSPVAYAEFSADAHNYEWTVNIEQLHIVTPVVSGEVPSNSHSILLQSLKAGIEACKDMQILISLVEHALHIHFNILPVLHNEDFQQRQQVIIHHYVPASIGEV
eukprot:Gregarina_sp_Pseudo_9__5537@NODE_72_length_4596_cov_32_745227_g66_i0_p2_GENE_NODE_72_length_4596_cov_32_745227_g66_i0NODE_72_length_4596_cov_32_745227_g66_i0_p2_ORF_typecomplete_len278_score37_36Mcl1_mid/PF12341_8/0_0053_NODE_72_length_4596_cov_32_745227_g66_i037134546